MQEAGVPLLTTWQNFYVIIGSAAATLTGLMFIVVTLIAGRGVRVSLTTGGIATYSTPSVVHFSAALLIAAMLSAPWQALWQIGLLLGLCGFSGIIYALIIIRRARRQSTYQPVLEDWLWHTIFPLISYTTFFIAAIMLPTNPAPTLFGVAAATVLLLFIGIHNAWDNITYITLNLLPTQNKNQD